VSHRKDLVLNWVLAMVAVLVLGSAVMLVVALPAIFSARNNTDEVRRGNEMAACRALLAYDVNSAKADLDIVFALGLQAAVADDDVTLRTQADLIPERAKLLRDALEAQRVGNELSRDDPAAFLRECER
jgi:hypothetical protein